MDGKFCKCSIIYWLVFNWTSNRLFKWFFWRTHYDSIKLVVVSIFASCQINCIYQLVLLKSISGTGVEHIHATSIEKEYVSTFYHVWLMQHLYIPFANIFFLWAYYVQNWRTIMISLSLPHFTSKLTLFVVPENYMKNKFYKSQNSTKHVN